jgi:hypothetical protein
MESAVTACPSTVEFLLSPGKICKKDVKDGICGRKLKDK